MEVEIIKTDNPNIVIERTVTEREIDISGLREQISNFELEINQIDEEIEQLEQSKQGLPNFITTIINDKITELLSNKSTAQYQIQLLNTEISKLNG